MQNKLEMLRIFKVVAESANFKEASVKLGVSPQSVTRAKNAVREPRQRKGMLPLLPSGPGGVHKLNPPRPLTTRPR